LAASIEPFVFGLTRSEFQACAEVESVAFDAFADIEVVDGPRERLAWASSQASGKFTDDAKFTSSHCAPWFRRNHTGERSDLHARNGPAQATFYSKSARDSESQHCQSSQHEGDSRFHFFCPCS